MKKLSILLIIVMLAISFISISAKDKKEIFNITFIVGKDIPKNEFTKKELKKIFLGKKKNCKNKKRITPIINIQESKIFYKFIGKSQTNYEKYWEKLLFTGKAQEPVKLKTTEEVIQYIKKHPDGISFIPTQDSLNIKEIKIIKIID